MPTGAGAGPSTTCGARNVYIDAGVNWCNTLQLFKQVPEARSRAEEPWLVFGFEASPRIAPFAERCAQALSAGQPLPSPPIPPVGSTRELIKHAPKHNCSMSALGLRVLSCVRSLVSHAPYAHTSSPASPRSDPSMPPSEASGVGLAFFVHICLFASLQSSKDSFQEQALSSLLNNPVFPS